MKKLLPLLLLPIAACTVHQAQQDKFVPSKQMAQNSGIPLDRLQEGHAIFMTQCSQCHEQRIPNEIPTGEWHVIVPGMAWNAGLSKQEEAKVNDYITAASKVR